MLVTASAFLYIAALFPTAPPDAGTILGGVAKLVLQARLREADAINVDVKASPSAILSGGVDSVRVRGRRWCTPLLLSCQSLDMTVGRTSVDPSALLTSRQIVMRDPAHGQAQISFTSGDWDNFLLHPLMKDAVAARLSAASATRIGFERARACIVKSDGEGPGAVEFSCTWDGGDVRARLTQNPQDGRVVVTAENSDASEWLAALFQSLVLDLDGCELSFERLRIDATSTSPLVCLDLSVMVRSFPSLSINF